MFEGKVDRVVAPTPLLLVALDDSPCLLLGHSWRVSPVGVDVVMVCTADTHDHAGQTTSRTEHTSFIEGLFVQHVMSVHMTHDASATEFTPLLLCQFPWASDFPSPPSVVFRQNLNYLSTNEKRPRCGVALHRRLVALPCVVSSQRGGLGFAPSFFNSSPYIL